MEDFRKCMEDNGAPAPPDPSNIDPSNPPKPPSAADRDKIQKAYAACRDKLPTDIQHAGPPGIATFKRGPPPGAPGQPPKGQNQDQSNNSARARAAPAPDQGRSTQTASPPTPHRYPRERAP